MKRFVLVLLLIFALSASGWLISIYAQSGTASWAFLVEVQPPPAGPALYDLTVPLQVMNGSRGDLSDLRLFDAQGQEIPYAIRIRKDVDESTIVGGSPFNQANVGSASEVSVDLGEGSGEHNELEIQTTGRNFRRRVNIEGGDTGKDWKTLQSEALIFGFESQNKTVQSNRVSYPTSRYRFLRVRVFSDELADDEPPVIRSVSAVKVQRASGELTTWNVNIPSYQLLRYEGAPSSSWNIDLGFYVPCDRLILDVGADSFSRPYHLEAVDDEQNLRLVASGELTRRVGEEVKPLVIRFDEEQLVRQLRLVIKDHSNQTLLLNDIKAGAPARQLVFELKAAPAQPLRLFYGNPKAEAPHYDFEKELSAKLSNTPVRVGVGPATANPDYKPEPLPLTERVPWLIYLVLGISTLVLGIILWKLAQSRINPESQDTEEGGAALG